MKKKISVTLAALLSLSVLCSGCSSQSDSTAGTAAAETEVQTTEAAETEAAATETAATEAAETEAQETTAAAGTETADQTTAAAETEASGALPDQASAETWSLISGYGFHDGTCDGKDISYSDLSFTLKTDTLQDLGDTYSVEAEIYKDVQIPADLAEGEETTFTIDELDGTTVTIVNNGEELVNKDDEYDTYYCGPADDSGSCTLMQNSDDAVCDHIADGTLIIRKDAVYGIDIMQEFETVDESNLAYDPWFNGVAFNENGEITALVFFGD